MLVHMYKVKGSGIGRMVMVMVEEVCGERREEVDWVVCGVQDSGFGALGVCRRVLFGLVG